MANNNLAVSQIMELFNQWLALISNSLPLGIFLSSADLQNQLFHTKNLSGIPSVSNNLDPDQA